MCKIGQKDRCDKGGCEWKKAFKQYCWLLKDEPKEIPDDANPTYKIHRRGRFVRGEKKYTEIKRIGELKVAVVEAENNFKTVPNDDWIKKIKVLKNENKF